MTRRTVKTVHLNTGKTIKIKCADINVTKRGGETTEVEFLDIAPGSNVPIHLVLEHVVAITYPRRRW